MKQIIAKFFTFLLIFSFIASPAVAQMMSLEADPSPLDEPETAHVQVAHLAPFAEDTSVTISLNGEPALNDFRYGDSTEYIELDAGTYEIAVIPTGADPADPPAIAATIDLAADTFYTVLAVGDGVNQELDLIVLEDDLTPPEAGKFHLRLGHLAPFAEGEGVLADVRVKDGIALAENVDFGGLTGYLALDVGTYDLVITTPGGGTVLIDPAPAAFAEGDILSAFAAGEGDNQDLGVYALPAGEEGFFLPMTAYVQVVHLAPFAEDASVTISLNGEPALTEFAYGDSTEYLELLWGENEIAVIPTGADPADPPAIAATVELAADTYYTVLAVGDGVNQALALKLLEDDNSAPEAGNFKLRLGHLAPFNDTLADTAADVRLADGNLILGNIEFGFVADSYMQYPAGTYDLVITTPGGDIILIDPAPVTFAEGDIVSAFAVGEGVNQDLGVYALPAGEEGFFLPPAEPEVFKNFLPLIFNHSYTYIQVVHLAPFAEDTSVTIALNGEPALTEFEYGDSTGYIKLPWGTYEITVIPAGADPADPPAIKATVNLAVGRYYTVIAIGDDVNQDLALQVMVDDMRKPAAGKFHLRLGHLAPFAEGEGVLADVRVRGVDEPLAKNVDFGAVTGYIPLDAGTYDLVITTPGGDTVLIDPAQVTFAEGEIVSAFAAGEGVNQDLGVYALPAGEEGFFLPMAAYVQVVHLAPFAEDASVTITLNGVPALAEFGYGASTEYIQLLVGEYDIAVIPTGESDPAIEDTVELAVGTYYTVIAIGDDENQDLALIVLEDDLSEPEAGKFHLRLGHLAPFAEGEGVLADVRVRDGEALAENVDFGAVTDFIPLDAGTYDLVITTPGGDTILIDPAPVTFAEGEIISAFAAGEGVNQDLGVFALPAGEEGFFLPLAEPEEFTYFFPLFYNYSFAYIQVAHLAPFAEDASVTITLNGEEALTEFGYGESTNYMKLLAGEYEIAIIPSGGNEAAITANVELIPDTYYTVLAVGDSVNQALDLIVLKDDLTEPDAGQFHLRLGHLAPFAEGPATADVRLKDGTPVLENVDFGILSGYLSLEAGEYDLVITTPGGGTVLIDPEPVTFVAGQIISAFAAGEGVNQDLGVFALPAGGEGFFLPLVD